MPHEIEQVGKVAKAKKETPDYGYKKEIEQEKSSRPPGMPPFMPPRDSNINPGMQWQEYDWKAAESSAQRDTAGR